MSGTQRAVKLRGWGDGVRAGRTRRVVNPLPLPVHLNARGEDAADRSLLQLVRPRPDQFLTLKRNGEVFLRDALFGAPAQKLMDGGAAIVAGGDCIGVVSRDGKLFMAKNDSWMPNPSFTLQAMPFQPRVKAVAIALHAAYAVTEQGRLWVWAWGENALAITDVAEADFPPAPRHVTELADGTASPAFALVSADMDSLCLADISGAVYACGRPFCAESITPPSFHRLPVRLPGLPAPARDLHAAYHGAFTCYMGAGGTPCNVIRDLNEQMNVGPLALLVDGTVFALAGQRRLPLLTRVESMAKAIGSNEFIFLRDNQRVLRVFPAQLLGGIGDWD